MATEARTIRIPVNTNAAATYEIPGGVDMDVQAVYVTIDATAAADTTAEITVAEQSGVVIAKKRQSTAVAAGTTGSATWALRLDDGGGTGSLTGFLHWGANTDTTNLGLTLTGNGSFSSTTNGNSYSIDTRGGAPVGGTYSVTTSNNLTLDATLANFSVHNNWQTVSSNGSTSLDLNATGVLNLNASTGAIVGTAQHDSSVTVSGAAGAGGGFQVSADDGISLIGGGSHGVTISAPSHGISSSSANVTVNLAAARSFVVNDSGGSPIMQLTS